MALNPSIQITSMSGTVKRIAASSIMGDMSSDAAWYSSAASTISLLPYTFTNANKEWIAWEHGNYVEIRFAPDSAGSNGQGMNVPGSGNVSWTVTAVSGTVYIVRRKYLSMADTHATMYSNANKVAAAVNDVLLTGDAIICAKTGAYFSVRAASSNDSPAQQALLAVVQLMSQE